MPVLPCQPSRGHHAYDQAGEQRSPAFVISPAQPTPRRRDASSLPTMRRTGALLATTLLLGGCASAQPDATAASVTTTPTSTPSASATPSPAPSVAVTVPDVRGLSLADAQAALAKVDLIGTASSGGATVTAQQPAAGLSVWSPSHVDLTMGDATPTYAVPDLTGQTPVDAMITYLDAIVAATHAGVATDYDVPPAPTFASDCLADGATVTGQQPAPGTVVDVTSTLTATC